MVERRGLTIVIAVVLWLPLAGCIHEAYSGPPRPRAELAVVSTIGGAVIETLDGEDVPDDWRGGTSKFEILPGKRRIGLTFEAMRAGSYNPQPLKRSSTACIDALTVRRRIVTAGPLTLL